jgi:predicted TIM-barrel fold metal-dependent hydrolase
MKAGLLGLALALPAWGAEILPVIDAHSQFDDRTPVAQVLEHAARAGVSQVLLSARGRVTPAQVIELASRHPGCVVASVRTKGRAELEEQRQPEFRAMSEIILVHAAKGRRAPEVNVLADAPHVEDAIRHAIARGWPVVLHYELRWLATARGSEARDKRMAELDALLARHPEQPFALIHMAQLDPGPAAALLETHRNVFFLTSHANPLAVQESRQPWTDMFSGEALAEPWQALVLRYPGRFVLALDNVWPEHWSERYAEQVALWRKALGKLPAEVAHAVAHGNAERLWKLAPAMAGSGCAALGR